MSIKLLAGPVGAGKTGHVLAALQALKREQPLAAVWALMATERQIAAFRNRLLAPGRGILNLTTFNFHMLYEQITQAAGQPQRVLHSAPREALLRELLRERWGQPGAIFRPLPGFVTIIGAFIDELKQWQISPEQFAAHAAADARLIELAAIYAGYQARLSALNLLDREGLGLYALDCLHDNPALGTEIEWLLVDGFDQFNPLHAALIAELGLRAANTTITLTLPHGHDAGHDGFSRFTLARDRLLSACRRAQGLPPDGPDNGMLTIEMLRAPAETTPARRAVRHLAGQVWSPLPERAAACAWGEADLCAPGVSFLEAPDPAAETAAVLRRVKALLLGVAGAGAACRPDDILIAARDWGRYGPHLGALGARYGVPLALHQGEPLAGNPAVAALLRALALPESNYRRQEVLDALASPYIRVPGMPEGGLALLEQAARDQVVIGGRGEWRAALAALARGLPPIMADDDADTDDSGPLAVPAASVEATAAALEGWFDALELFPLARMADFTEQIDQFIGPDERDLLPFEEADDAGAPAWSLQILAAVRGDRHEARKARDLKALQALKRALRSLRASSALLLGMGVLAADELTRAGFMADLRREIAGVTLDDSAGRDGRVLATTVSDARGLPHRHVFILGLSEGIFPAPVPEDPLLLESERAALRARGLPLPLRAERSDDAGLFYELAGLAGETLLLSRPSLRDGSEWIESAFWRAAAAAFEGPLLTKLKVGACTPAHEAATLDEALLAVGSACAENPMPAAESALAGWLAHSDGRAWARLGAAHGVEASRLSRGAAFDRYSGRLADGDLIAGLAQRFGPGYRWSASQLNQLGECGFRFFSSRLLGLQPLEPPQAGLDALQRGTLYHGLLEAVYRRIRDEELTLIPAHLERGLALLEEEADGLFARVRAGPGFRPGPGWAQEQQLIRQQAAGLLRADFDSNTVTDEQAGAPGSGAGERIVVEIERTYDAAALFTTASGQPVRVYGRIDRIDRQGDRWLVIDYKTGSTPIGSEETRRGRNFQMMIYLLALRAQQPNGAIGGFFWHLTNRDTSGTLWLDTGAGADVIAEGTERILQRIAEAQAGDFSVEPNGLEEDRCTRYCEYQALCRMAVMPRYKPRAGDSP